MVWLVSICSLSLGSKCLPWFAHSLTAKCLSFLPRFCVCENKVEGVKKVIVQVYLSRAWKMLQPHPSASLLLLEHTSFLGTPLSPDILEVWGDIKSSLWCSWLMAWELAHTWSKDTFCLLLPYRWSRNPILS